MAAPPALQRRFEQPHEILGLLLDFDVAVAQDAEHALADHREAGEEVIEIEPDHLLERQEAHRLAGQPDEAVERAGNEQQRLHPVAVAGPAQLQRQAQAEIGDEGKGMRRIDGERRQHREDLAHEALFEPGAVFGPQLLGPDHRDARLAHLLAQHAPRHLLVAHQLAGALVDRRELLRRGQAVLAGRRDAGEHLALEAGHPDHEELVQIVRRDRQEAQPLEQRMAGTVGLLEHALVEGKPAQLAIDESRRRLSVNR